MCVCVCVCVFNFFSVPCAPSLLYYPRSYTFSFYFQKSFILSTKPLCFSTFQQSRRTSVPSAPLGKDGSGIPPESNPCDEINFITCSALTDFSRPRGRSPSLSPFAAARGLVGNRGAALGAVYHPLPRGAPWLLVGSDDGHNKQQRLKRRTLTPTTA